MWQLRYILTHSWEPCQADHAAQPLLYQHHKSLVSQHKKRANKTANMGGGGQAMRARQQKQLNSETPCDLKKPCTLEPILPAMCEKNVFRFFRSSASGKPHLPLLASCVCSKMFISWR